MVDKKEKEVKKENKKEIDKKLKKELSKQFYEIFVKVISSEKATRLQEFDNCVVFEVERHANKSLIKLLVENEFKKRVKSVRTQNNIKSRKIAYVTFKDDNVAIDIISKLELA
jgi:ribosomal protein L23